MVQVRTADRLNCHQRADLRLALKIKQMDTNLKQYLQSLNIRVVNNIYSERHKRRDEDVVGWHLASTSNLRYNKHMEMISEWLAKSDLDYYLVDPMDAGLSFYIYK